MSCSECGRSFGKRKGVKKSKKSKKTKKTMKSMKKRNYHRRRAFGSEMIAGEGYKGLTSYPNNYVNYFGSYEPFINAPEWWAPITNGRPQIMPQVVLPNGGM